MSKSNWFELLRYPDPGNEVATLHVWFKNLASPFHPIKSKTNTNCYSFAHVFPRFASAVASQADVLRLVTRSSPHSVRAEERVTSLRTSAWEATSAMYTSSFDWFIVLSASFDIGSLYCVCSL